MERAQQRELDRDQFILRQGELAVAVYFLIDGHAKLTQITPDGHQIAAHCSLNPSTPLPAAIGVLDRSSRSSTWWAYSSSGIGGTRLGRI